MATFDDLEEARVCKIEQINETWEVLDILLSNLSMMTPGIMLTENGTTLITEMPIRAAQNTLISIDFCVQKGFLSDAFVLMRKYRDDLLMYLFLCYEVEGIDEPEIEIESRNFKDMTANDFLRIFMDYCDKEKNTAPQNPEKAIIEKWVKGSYRKNAPQRVKNIFSAGQYKRKIKAQPLKQSDGTKSNLRAKAISDAWNKIDQAYTEIDRQLNSFVHVNAPEFIESNGLLPGDKKRKKVEEAFDILEKITVVFLCLLAMIKPVAFSANDYIDVLEITGKVEDGLQYKVPKGITEYLKQYSDKVNPAILEYVNNENWAKMKFIDVEN